MSLLRSCWIDATVMFGVLVSPAFGDTPFAAEVIEFAPAPGQFVNNPYFNDATVALGPPSGSGTYAPDNTSIVSLGGFGGYITLQFDHIVEDDLLNPFGMDAIVFGNSFWVDSQAQRHWAECATIEIALDANGNGWIDEDEGWYLIPGSHITDPATQYATRTWDDDPDTEIPPELLSWIPPGYSGTWITSAYELPPDPFAQAVIENPSPDEGVEGIYGYAEYTPTLVLGDLDVDNQVDDPLITPEEFYTVPDDPLTVRITPGSGGGDAFDIAWAIDPETGLPAELPGFDFIRLTNAVDALVGPFGEKSPEIDAVADVAPDTFGDCDGDGDIDLADALFLQNCYEQLVARSDPCAFVDRDVDGFIGASDAAAFMSRLTGPRECRFNKGYSAFFPPY